MAWDCSCLICFHYNQLVALCLQSYQNQLDQTERHLEVQDVPREFVQGDMQV